MPKSEWKTWEHDVTSSLIVGSDGVYLEVRKGDEVVWNTTVPENRVRLARRVQDSIARQHAKAV